MSGAAQPASLRRSRPASDAVRPWRPGPSGGLIAAAAVGLVFLGLPVVALVVRSLASGSLVTAVADRAVVDALTLSLVTSTVSVAIGVLLGLPIAILLARHTFRGRVVAEALVDLPIVLPPSVAGLALLFAFGRRGAVGPALELVGITLPFTTVAVVLAQVFVSMPFFIRAARAGIRAIPRELDDAARVDGAAEGAIVRRVTLPLAASALGAGLVLAWARAMGEFGATILFAGNIEGRTQTLPLLVYSEFQGSLDAAVAAATILVIAAVGVLVAVRSLRLPWDTGWGT